MDFVQKYVLINKQKKNVHLDGVLETRLQKKKKKVGEIKFPCSE